MTSLTQYFIGVDLHKTVIQVCVLDRQGEVVLERRYLAKDLVIGQTIVGELLCY